MGSFFNLHWWISQTPKARATTGVGNMLSEKILKSWCSETSFLMFWEDKLCLKCSVFVPIFMFTTLHTSTPISGVHYGTQNYRRLMLRYQKDKNGWETTEKCQRIVLKKDWLNKENIIFLWLGRVSKTGRILCENERPEIFAENRRFPAKMGGLVSPWNFIARILFSWNQSPPDGLLKSPIHPLKVKWPTPYDHFLHPSAIKLANA